MKISDLVLMCLKAIIEHPCKQEISIPYLGRYYIERSSDFEQSGIYCLKEMRLPTDRLIKGFKIKSDLVILSEVLAFEILHENSKK